MKKLVIAALALGAAAMLTTPATAAQDPQGRKCGFNSATDVTTEPGVQTGAINAGPLVTFEPGVLVCSVHVNNNSHDGAVATALPIPCVGVGAVNVCAGGGPIKYNATAADSVSLCTEFDGASGTWYWSGGTIPGTGTWSQDASSSCGQATTIDPNPQACPILLAIDQRLGTPLADTWQDCGPYSPII